MVGRPGECRPGGSPAGRGAGACSHRPEATGAPVPPSGWDRSGGWSADSGGRGGGEPDADRLADGHTGEPGTRSRRRSGAGPPARSPPVARSPGTWPSPTGPSRRPGMLVATVVPTATHEPAAHDTPSRSAAVGVTGADPGDAAVGRREDHALAGAGPPSTLAVVPTAAQAAATLDRRRRGGPVTGRRRPRRAGHCPERPGPDGNLSRGSRWPPVAGGGDRPEDVADVDQLRDGRPAVRGCRCTTAPVAAEAEAGNAPPATQAPDADGVRVVTRPETTPRAMHDPADRQSTAVTSVVPAGTASRVQVDPPSVVVTMAPGPTPVQADLADRRARPGRRSRRWPTGSPPSGERPGRSRWRRRRRWSPDAAPAGADGVANVEPTAQHRSGGRAGDAPQRLDRVPAGWSPPGSPARGRGTWRRWRPGRCGDPGPSCCTPPWWPAAPRRPGPPSAGGSPGAGPSGSVRGPHTRHRSSLPPARWSLGAPEPAPRPFEIVPRTGRWSR